MLYLIQPNFSQVTAFVIIKSGTLLAPAFAPFDNLNIPDNSVKVKIQYISDSKALNNSIDPTNFIMRKYVRASSNKVLRSLLGSFREIPMQLVLENKWGKSTSSLST